MSVHWLLKGHNLKLVVTARMHAVYWFGLCSALGSQCTLRVTSGKCKADFALDSKAWKGVVKLLNMYG